MEFKRKRYCSIAGCLNFVGTKSTEFTFFRYVKKEMEPKWTNFCHFFLKIAIFFYLNSRIPLNDEIKETWLRNIAKHQEVQSLSSQSLLCSLHFSPDYFMDEKKLFPDATPTIFPINRLPVNTCQTNESSDESRHFNRFCPSQSGRVMENKIQDIE